MDITNFVLKGLDVLEDTITNSVFTWKGESFSCVPNSVKESLKNTNPYFIDNTDFRMTVRLNQFTTNIYPQVNDYIQYQGYSLLIKDIIKPGHGIYWVLVTSNPTINK